MESIEEVILTEIRDNYPFLYNIRDRKYRIKEERDRAWEEIACIVDLDSKSCKTRWRSVRDRYLKERRRVPDGQERKRWRLMPKLTFLDDMLEAKSPRTPSTYKRRESANLSSDFLLSTASSPAATVNSIANDSSANDSGANKSIANDSSANDSGVNKSSANNSSATATATTTTTHRILLPAMALPSTTTSGRQTSGATGSVFPVSILKAAAGGSPAGGGGSPQAELSIRRIPAIQPAPPTITSTASLLLLPASSSRAPCTITTTTPAISHAPLMSDPQRLENDQSAKALLNPPQNLDEEDYYGLSVAGRLKKLAQRDRALVRIEIEKLFLKYET